MKTVMAHASGERSSTPFSARAGARSGCCFRPRSARGHQTRAAIRDGAAHAARASRQPPMWSSGTARPAAAAPLTDISIIARPVSGPTWRGKACLMTAGTSTLPVAIPAPASTVPVNSAGWAGSTRSRSPAVSTTSATVIAAWVPMRRASTGVSAEKMPRHSSGRVASTPASTPVSPKVSWSWPRTGGMPVMAARRLRVSSTRPMRVQRAVRRVMRGVDVMSPDRGGGAGCRVRPRRVPCRRCRRGPGASEGVRRRSGSRPRRLRWWCAGKRGCSCRCTCQQDDPGRPLRSIARFAGRVCKIVS